MRADDSIEFHFDGGDIMRDGILAGKEMPASVSCIQPSASVLILIHDHNQPDHLALPYRQEVNAVRETSGSESLREATTPGLA